MSYRVDLTRHARRGYNRLPIEAATAVGALFDGLLASNPRRVGSVLLDPPLQGGYRAKRGDYVVRYDIDEQAQIVIVRRVDHRRTVYARPLPR